MYKVTVRLMSATTAFDRPYSYLYHEELMPGSVAALPFGSSDRHQYGIVISSEKTDNEEGLKRILFTLPEPYVLTRSQLDTAQFMSERFFASFGDCARLMLPTGLDIDTAEYIIRGEHFDALDNVELKSRLEREERVYLDSNLTKKDVAPYIKKSCIALKTEALCHINEKKERYAKAISVSEEERAQRLKGAKSKEKYNTLLEHLCGAGEMPVKSLYEIYSLDSAGLSFLKKRGLIEIVTHSVERNAYSVPDVSQEPIKIELSDEQNQAYNTLADMLDSQKGCAALLYGVTGSGKTSVILSLVDKAVADRRGVIMLVPEIALTSQSAEVLFSRYGDKVAVIHSGMSKGERHDSWEAIKSGRKSIVLGTRSAIFAPVKNLGLLIIDEEQDDSYKSDTTPRYHARDVARFICASSNSLMLLSSATPDVESFYNAQKGKYKLVTLKKRYGGAILPDVVIADVMNDGVSSPDRLVGAELEERLNRTLDRGEQAVIFVNRRGLKKLLTCRDCKSAVTCPNCSVSMTLHQMGEAHRLVCHYCGYSMIPPSKCPSCSSEHMQYRGYGTQKLEQELKALFPQARVMRMDADTTRKKLSHDELIDDFSSHKADILIGTQMVAKGHNFPDVTLVGVIMADLSLFSSDYRANEHTFSLMTQVVGRAGRGKKKGSAVIQTMNPHHEVIELCTTQDYDTFYDGEIELRRALTFPPFCTVGVFVLTSDSERELDKACEKLNETVGKLLNTEFSDVKIIAYGPFDAVPYKLKNSFRRKLVVKYKNDKRTRELFKAVLSSFNTKDVKCSFDASPTTL